LSTAPDDKVRDGKRAVEAAKKACELTSHKNGGFLDTLAAAYAEAGEFDKAVEWQEKALKAGDIPIADLNAARKRLEMFKQKKAYRGDE
jgi:tetratricopeptide (TPR) repeat protein